MAEYGNISPNEGRFQTHLVYQHQSTINLKTGTGDQFFFQVVHPFIEILRWGWGIVTAPGAVSTAGAARLERIPVNNGARVTAITPGAVASKSTLTFDGAKSIYSLQEQDLNVGVGLLNPLDQQSRPFANKGDFLVFNITVQGVGAGAQDVRPFVVFRERTRNGN